MKKNKFTKKMNSFIEEFYKIKKNKSKQIKLRQIKQKNNNIIFI